MKTHLETGKPWINVTNTSSIRKRMTMAQQARQKAKGNGVLGSLFTNRCYRIREQLPPDINQRMGMYLFSSADISTFIDSTDMRSAIFFDRYGFLAREKWGHDLPGRLHHLPNPDWKPEAVDTGTLREAFEDKCQSGYWNNYYSAAFKETGVFALIELLDLEAGNIQVYRDKRAKDYLLTFDLSKQSFRIIFRSGYVSIDNFRQILDETPATLFFVKAGNQLEYEKIPDERFRKRKKFFGGDFLRATGEMYPPGSYLVSFVERDSRHPSVAPVSYTIPSFSLIATVQVGDLGLSLAHVYYKEPAER